MGFKLPKHMPVAVDVGTSSLRAVQAAERAGRLHVQAWINRRRSAGGQNDETPSGDGASLPGTPGSPFLSQEIFSGREVVTCLAPPQVQLCSLSVPSKLLSNDKDSIAKAIGHEVASQTNISVENAEMGFWKLPPGNGGGPNVMVAVAPRSHIEDLLEWVRSEGWSCKRIELAPLASLRACVRSMDRSWADQLIGILDIGAQASRLYLGIGEIPVYVRCLSFSGDNATERIAAELQVERNTAEKYKRHYGIHANQGGYRTLQVPEIAVNTNRMSSILHAVLYPMIKRLASEIEKSFRYAIELYPQQPVGSLVLIGAGANLSGMDELLAELLGIPVRRASAGQKYWYGVDHPALSDANFPLMLNCLGLAFAEMN